MVIESENALDDKLFYRAFEDGLGIFNELSLNRTVSYDVTL